MQQKLRNNKFELIQMQPHNTQSVVVRSGTDCVIFDPWGTADDWGAVLDKRGLKLRAIYVTHGHPDHISAAPKLAQKYNVPWYLHNADFRLVGWGNDLLAYFGLSSITINDIRPTSLDLTDTEILPNLHMQIIETPGHTPGGVAYYFPNENVIIIGDTLFQDSIGRYDLPGGDKNMLFQSISKLHSMQLPDKTEVVHGHGMATTIDWLHKNNPYFHK